mmetsp:Transcript_16151/g.23438  ORF Transcript_16151/g.23438 Transcript_16151/m.23438 type:complete len:83 (+) Transcript_16151:2781-3029(+)
MMLSFLISFVENNAKIKGARMCRSLTTYCSWLFCLTLKNDGLWVQRLNGQDGPIGKSISCDHCGGMLDIGSKLNSTFHPVRR